MFPLLYLLSALIGTVVAIDPIAASGKFILIVLGIALSVSVPRLPERAQRILFVTLPAIISIYFLLTNDWAARIGKVPTFDPMLRAFSVLSVPLSAFSINSNIVGGVIAAYIPLQVRALALPRSDGVGADGLSHRMGGGLPLPLALIGLSLGVLLISLSRGAWIALAFVAFAWLLYHGLQRTMPPMRVLPLWMGLIAGIVLLLGVLLTSTEPGNRFLDAVSGYRGPIWRDSFTLVRDFAFTGIGLSHFEEFYSAYVLLVHVPFLYHAHNLLLDIWLGQGLLGLVAFGGWLVTAIRNQGSQKRSDTRTLVSDRWNAAALASLGVILIHGLFDDPFYGYGAYTLPLLFVPLGVLSRRDGPASRLLASRLLASRLLASRLLASRLLAGRLYMAGGAVALAAAALVWFIPSLRASLYANLGALTQARTELSGYTYQTWGVQDNVRRSSTINLQWAIGYYQEALRLDPTNPTAHLRLGQIDLAYSRFEPACTHFLAAFDANPNNRAARQYMGECAALAGETDKAIMLWRSIETGQGQLAVRVAWYNDFLADKPRAERISAVVQALGQ